MDLRDIEWAAGDHYPIQLTIKNKSTGEKINLTGYTFTMSVSKEDSGSPIIFSVNGVVDPDQTNNTGELSFTPQESDTSDLSPGRYYYRIAMFDTSSNKRTIRKGVFQIV